MICLFFFFFLLAGIFGLGIKILFENACFLKNLKRIIKIIFFIFLNCFNMLTSKIILKKYYFNIFSNKKHFKK